ncbi:MAG: ABC transporter permease [wastewater metagenome]|nr:ABC transporter permease [Candidatus Loosdrechtia aerotolerans]
MVNPLEYIGRNSLNLFQLVGELIQLFIHTLYWCKQALRNLDKIFYFMVRMGVNTLPIASFTSLFVGMVMVLQTGYTLEKFGMAESLGAIVPIAMARELGPVLTALLLAGRIGAAITAEIGTMTVSEEVDALKTLGINPIGYLAMPRFLACLFMLPVLVVYADVVGILGGAVVTTAYFQIPVTIYFDRMAESLEVIDIIKGLVKAAVFGVTIAIVGCRYGLKTSGGAAGVGEATTRSVVCSFVSIYILNYFITRLWM